MTPKEAHDRRIEIQENVIAGSVVGFAVFLFLYLLVGLAYQCMPNVQDLKARLSKIEDKIMSDQDQVEKLTKQLAFIDAVSWDCVVELTDGSNVTDLAYVAFDDSNMIFKDLQGNRLTIPKIQVKRVTNSAAK